MEFPAHVAFCSIGAVWEINTPNENEAARWLAKAIDAAFDRDRDNAKSIIINANDANKTKWSDVKGWFTKAIKLAKAAGQ